MKTALNLISARIASEKRSLPEVRELITKLPRAFNVANNGSFQLATFGRSEICYVYFAASTTCWLIFSNVVVGQEVTGYYVNAMQLISPKSSPQDITDASVKGKLYTQIDAQLITKLLGKHFKATVTTARVARERPEFSNVKDAPKSFEVDGQKFKRVMKPNHEIAAYESDKYEVTVHFDNTANSKPVVVVSRCREDFHVISLRADGKPKSPTTVTPIYFFPITVDDFQDLIGLCIERIKI